MGIGKVSKILLLIVSLSLNFFNCNGADRLPGIQNQNLSGFPKEPSDHPLPEMTFSGRKNRHLTARLSYHHINFMITSHTVYPSFHRQGLSPGSPWLLLPWKICNPCLHPLLFHFHQFLSFCLYLVQPAGYRLVRNRFAALLN